jgi:anti-sigma B factor antagonist
MHTAASLGASDSPGTLGVPSFGDVAVIALTGELDILTVPSARQVLIDGTARVAPRVVIDLSDVTFCDSSGIGLLVGQYKRVRARGGVMALACPTPRVRAVLHVTGMARSRIFRVYDTLDEARSGVSE